jgi:hypothetical protein
MRGQCGANSISSSTDLETVTCKACKIIEDEKMATTKISFEEWMEKNGVIWNHLREADKRVAVLKWKSEQ